MEKKANFPSYVRPPEPNELEALAALQDNVNFTVIMQWLLNSSGDAEADLRLLTDTTSFYRAQGGANTLSSIVLHAGKAREIIRNKKEKNSVTAIKREPTNQVSEKGMP